MRIVSLVPSVTETLIELGLSDRLVGITRFCIHPRAVVDTIAKVGGTKDPKLDRIRALRPDLVFLNEEENRREDFEALRGEFRLETAFPRRIDEVPGVLRRIGEVCDVREPAARAAATLERALADLDARRVPERTFRFAYLIWRKPWMTLNADTYVSDLLTRAGGINVFGQTEARYPQVSLETIAAQDPDVVLLPDEPFPFKPAHRDEVAEAVPDAGVELISGDDACWHGVRSVRGVALAAALADRWAKTR